MQAPYTGMQVCAIMCTQIHSHVHTPVLCSTMDIRRMSWVHVPRLFSHPETSSLPELYGLLASALEEERQREGLGAHRMMKCSGSSNSFGDEFISFLTTLKSQEGIVACFGDKKNEVVRVTDHACGKTRLPTGRLGIRD